jgi:hypothetical protein
MSKILRLFGVVGFFAVAFICAVSGVSAADGVFAVASFPGVPKL